MILVDKYRLHLQAGQVGQNLPAILTGSRITTGQHQTTTRTKDPPDLAKGGSTVRCERQRIHADRPVNALIGQHCVLERRSAKLCPGRNPESGGPDDASCTPTLLKSIPIN